MPYLCICLAFGPRLLVTLKTVLPGFVHLLQAVLKMLASVTLFVLQLDRTLLETLDLSTASQADTHSCSRVTRRCCKAESKLSGLPQVCTPRSVLKPQSYLNTNTLSSLRRAKQTQRAAAIATRALPACRHGRTEEVANTRVSASSLWPSFA